jgi:hypothetical protein
MSSIWRSRESEVCRPRLHPEIGMAARTTNKNMAAQDAAEQWFEAFPRIFMIEGR